MPFSLAPDESRGRTSSRNVPASSVKYVQTFSLLIRKRCRTSAEQLPVIVPITAAPSLFFRIIERKRRSLARCTRKHLSLRPKASGTKRSRWRLLPYMVNKHRVVFFWSQNTMQGGGGAGSTNGNSDFLSARRRSYCS